MPRRYCRPGCCPRKLILAIFVDLETNGTILTFYSLQLILMMMNYENIGEPKERSADKDLNTQACAMQRELSNGKTPVAMKN